MYINDCYRNNIEPDMSLFVDIEENKEKTCGHEVY